MTELVSHAWSAHGNIRGLEHVVTRAVLLAPPGARAIGVDLLQFDAVRGGVAAARRPATRAAPASKPSASTPTPAAPPAPGRPLAWRAAGRRRPGLRNLLAEKLEEHHADLDEVARDPELRAFSGHGEERVPQSTLYGWIRDLDLKPVLEAARRRARRSLFDRVAAAIRRHGTASAAARALGMSRSAVVWQLRRAGTTVAEVLEGE
jgi:DNA-binding NtrC family response regulator